LKMKYWLNHGVVKDQPRPTVTLLGQMGIRIVMSIQEANKVVDVIREFKVL